MPNLRDQPVQGGPTMPVYLMNAGSSDPADAVKVVGVAGATPVPVLPTNSSGVALPVNYGFSIPVVLTVTNGAYSIGDVVGGLITLPNVFSAAGKRSVISNISLAGVVAIPYELWFFNADIATPAADNAALALAAADQAKFLGGLAIASTDYLAAQNAFNFGTKETWLLLKGATTSLFAYLKATAVTSPGTTALNLIVSGFWVD